jgi:hypothetical protein
MAAPFAGSLSRTFCWMNRCREGASQARSQRSLMRTWTVGTVQIAHGPPFTENPAKIPYKSMTVGTECGEGANRTYEPYRSNYRAPQQ